MPIKSLLLLLLCFSTGGVSSLDVSLLETILKMEFGGWNFGRVSLPAPLVPVFCGITKKKKKKMKKKKKKKKRV